MKIKLEFDLTTQQCRHIIDGVLVPFMVKRHAQLNTLNPKFRIKEGTPKSDQYYATLDVMAKMHTWYIKNPHVKRPIWFSRPGQ